MKNNFLICLIIFVLFSNTVFSLTDDEKELFNAVETANVQRINELLKKADIDINARDDEGYTPLLRAVYYNKRSSVNALLQARALDKEAKLSIPTEINGWYLDGATATTLASFFGYNEILVLLADNGCSLDSRDILDGALPIHTAAANGNLDTVKRLIVYNKNYASAKTIEGSTPLMWAAMKDKNDVVAYLVNISDLETKDVEGWTALHYASAFASPATVEILLKAGAFVNETENDGKTSLDLARNDSIKKVLLDNGAKGYNEIYASTGVETEELPTTPTQDNSTVIVDNLDNNSEYLDSLEYKNLKPSQIQFLLDIKDGDILAINQYIKNNQDVNFTNEYGFTPLSYAVVYKKADSLEALLQSQYLNKDPVFSKDAEYDGWYLSGATPLILASYLGYDDMVSLLLQNGADVNKRDDVDGAMAIHAAAANGNIDVVTTIINYDGSTINAIDTTGFTPLHWATMYSQKEVIIELLDNKANVNIADDDGTMPIHIAAQNGDSEIVSLLLKNGADVNAKDNNSNTALHFATYGGYNSTVGKLVAHKADKNILNNEGKKAIDIAIGNEDTDIIKTLNKRERGNSKWWIIY